VSGNYMTDPVSARCNDGGPFCSQSSTFCSLSVNTPVPPHAHHHARWKFHAQEPMHVQIAVQRETRSGPMLTGR